MGYVDIFYHEYSNDLVGYIESKILLTRNISVMKVIVIYKINNCYDGEILHYFEEIKNLYLE